MMPKAVFLNITNKCNLHCKHCYLDSGKELDDELSRDEWFSVIDSLKEGGVDHVRINGGEPLMRDDCTNIMRYADELGMKTSIVSNSLLYDAEIFDRMPKKASLNFSVDGASPGTHDYMRNSPGLFNHLVKTIKEARGRGFDVRTFTVMSKVNVHEAEGIVDLLDGLSVSSAALFYLSPFGRAAEQANLAIPPKEWMDVLNRVSDHVKKTRPSLKLFVEPTFEGYFKGKPACSLYNGNICSIGPRGDVYFCSAMIDGTGQYSLGNVKEKSFSDIWNDASARKRIADLAKDKGTCTAYQLRCGSQGCEPKPQCYMHWEEVR